MRALGLSRLALRIGAVLVAAAFAFLLAYGLAAQAPDATIADALSRGETVRAPAFELEILEKGGVPPNLAGVVGEVTADGRIALAELRGTPVVLNLWASWCEPCRVEAPALEAAWREHGPRGVLFLGLDQLDNRDAARAFIDEFGVTYPNIRESGNEVARDYGAVALPETFFISSDGRIVAHVIGAVNEAQLARGVEAARTGRPETLGTGGARRDSR